MAYPSQENLHIIRFEGELLPNWAQLLDLGSRLCSVPEETRRWFSMFTNANGADDSRTVSFHCKLLRTELQERREQVLSELVAEQQDQQASRIFSAWLYALDTMIQQASGKQTCTWFIEGSPKTDEDDFGDDGEITLRRV